MNKNFFVKISVIIPMYNVENYIDQTLQSALGQTLREIEVICVDDGSSDKTVETVRKIAGDDERVKVISKANGGASSARNVGIEAARGEYLYFLDSDDYIAPDTLEMLYHEVREHQLDNVYFDAETFFDTPELEAELGHYKNYYRRSQDYSEIITGPAMYAAMEMHYDFKPSPCLQLIKSTVLTENKIRFYEGIVMEDNLFSLQVILKCGRVKHVAKSYYKRRIRADSVMTNAGFFHSYSYYVCIREIMCYARDKGFDSNICQAIAHRCRAMQKSALDKLEVLSQAEIDHGVAGLSSEEQVEFAVIISNQLRERQIAGERIKRIQTSAAYRTGERILSVPDRIKNIFR